MKKNNWELIFVLAKADFRLRYQGSMLGFLWVILKPLILFSILNFVFTNLFGGGPNFSIGLFTGIILWSFFSEGTMTGLMSLLNKGHIITKIYIPKWAIIVASTMNALFSFVLNLGVLAVFFLIAKIYPSPAFLLLSLYYCILVYFLILAFSFLFAPLYLKFRDLNQIWEVILSAGFYACPILYPLEKLPVNLQTILFLNPMTFVIFHLKKLLIDNVLIAPMTHFVYLGIVVFLFLLSIFIFKKTSLRAAENV